MPDRAATALVLALMLLLASLGWSDGRAGTMTTDDMLTDFTTLQPPASPNTWLVAPDGFTQATPDEIAPTFAVDALRLAAAWRSVVTAEPRTRVVGVSADGLQLEAEQRSAVFGFVDDISFQAIPLADDRSTFAVYSRARIGYWDLGVNRRRVGAWLARLRQELGAD